MEKRYSNSTKTGRGKPCPYGREAKMSGMTREQKNAVEQAMELLKNAGIDARLSTFWMSDGKRYVIVLRNIEVPEEMKTRDESEQL